MLKMNSKGQAFEPYRLVIGVVMGLLILLIIIGAIEYFNNLKYEISTTQLLDGFENAVQAHDGSVVVKESLSLKEGGYSSASFGNPYGIDEECIEFQSSGISSYSIYNNGKEIGLNNNVFTTVYFKCGPDSAMPGECSFYCIISFGKKP